MIVVDLDGTLVRCNSFKVFARFLRSKALEQHSYVSLCKWVFWGIMRKLHIVSHRRLKWELMKIADKELTDSDYERLADFILYYLNPHVTEFLSDKEWMLASAASEEYVSFVARKLNCQHYVATKRPATRRYADYTESRRDRKLKAVNEILGPCTLDIAISDHYDDLPLLNAAKEAIVVNPRPVTLNHPEIKHLNPEIWHN